jgi:RNA polymerase sigma-70 factor (ECF subfamily)
VIVSPEEAQYLEEDMSLELVLSPLAATPEAVRDARLRAMVGEHFDAVWRALRRLGVVEASADDAAQEVFLVASRRLDEIVVGRERAYLLGIAVRVAASVRSAEGRRREVPLEEGADFLDEQASPDDMLDEQRARAVLGSILESMPLEMREAFVLFELEELGAAEVAETLGIPIGTVASRVRRAREHVRQRLSRRSLASRARPGALAGERERR